MNRKSALLVAIAATVLTLAGCGSGDPETDEQTHTAANGDTFNDADVAFATDMIPHHAQALSMVDLTMGRPIDPAVQRLAEDIRSAQAPEIETMAGWLTDWDKPVPETMRDHAHAHGDMKMDAEGRGMMSADEMEDLEKASDAEFQELWLEMMVKHHQGAVEMAQTEQSEGVFKGAVKLAGAIEVSQTDEIDAMKDLLGS